MSEYLFTQQYFSKIVRTFENLFTTDKPKSHFFNSSWIQAYLMPNTPLMSRTNSGRKTQRNDPILLLHLIHPLWNRSLRRVHWIDYDFFKLLVYQYVKIVCDFLKNLQVELCMALSKIAPNVHFEYRMAPFCLNCPVRLLPSLRSHQSI